MCNSCESVVINGKLCHEHGCPEQEYEKECSWCGCEFKTKHKNEFVCSEDCHKNYFGICDDEEDLEQD